MKEKKTVGYWQGYYQDIPPFFTFLYATKPYSIEYEINGEYYKANVWGNRKDIKGCNLISIEEDKEKPGYNKEIKLRKNMNRSEVDGLVLKKEVIIEENEVEFYYSTIPYYFEYNIEIPPK